MSERKRIYLCLAHMSEAGLEQKYIKEAFDTNWVVPLGPNVNGFEADLEAFVNEIPHQVRNEVVKRKIRIYDIRRIIEHSPIFTGERGQACRVGRVPAQFEQVPLRA